MLRSSFSSGRRHSVLWTGHAVRRLRLALSVRTPLRGLHHVYPRPYRGFRDMHYALELGIMLRGGSRRFYQDRTLDLKPGQVWLCGMWEPHGFSVREAPCEVVVLVIWPELLAQMSFSEAPRFRWIAPFIAPPGKRPQVSRSRQGQVIALGRRLVPLLAHTDARSKLQIRLILMEILLILTEYWKYPASRTLNTADAYRRINRAIEMTFAGREFLPVERVAQLCGMSRNPFSRLFHDVMGIHFPDFALRYRLSQAAEQIARTGEPLKSAARAWGFTDHSHFHRVFVRLYGCSPRVYCRRLTARA